MKKALRETQKLRAGCSKTEPKIFAPPQTPSQWLLDGQNLISWRLSLLQTQFGEDWCTQISSYRGNRSTNTRTHPHTNRQDSLQYTVPQLH